MPKGGGSLLVTGGGLGGEATAVKILPEPFYFKVDTVDKKLTVRAPVGSVDTMLHKFGSAETDIFKSNLIMGGYRQIKASGEELFLIRQSTAGDLRSVAVGNMDTITPNSLICGPTGWRESRMRTDQPLTQAFTFTESVNARGGTRLTVLFTSVKAVSWRSFDITIAGGAAQGEVGFNTRIHNGTGGELLSEHQPEAQFMIGTGFRVFTRTLVDGVNNLPLPQPFPVPAGAVFEFVFDFEKPITGITLNSAVAKGFGLVLGRIGAITDMTIAEVAALPVAEKWRNREIQKTDGTKELCKYTADNAVLSPSGVPVGTILSGLWLHPSFGNLPIPDGYVALNGAVINAPWSALHGLTTPNTQGRVLANAGGGEAVGSYAGSSTYVIDRTYLPNILLNGSTSFTPSGLISTKTYPGYSTVPYASAGYTWSGPNSTGSSGIQHAACPSFGSVSMEHDHSFSGTTSAISITNIYLNGGVSQQAMPVRQLTYYVTQVIKL